MSSSTLPACSAALFALLLTLGCEGPSGSVQVDPNPAADSNLGDVEALKVIVRNVEVEVPDVFGPFPVDGQEHLLPATVPADTFFYVDVWACGDAECTVENLAGRGCNQVLLRLEAGKVGLLALDIYSRDQPEFAACPPRIHDE